MSFSDLLSQFATQAAMGGVSPQSRTGPGFMPGGARLDMLSPAEQIGAQFHMRDGQRMADANAGADVMMRDILSQQGPGPSRLDPSSPYMGAKARYFAQRDQPAEPLPPEFRQAAMSDQARQIMQEGAASRRAAYRSPFTEAEVAAAQAKRAARDAETEQRRRLVSNNAAAAQGKARPYKTGAELSGEDAFYARLNQQGDMARQGGQTMLMSKLLDQMSGDRNFDRQSAMMDRQGQTQRDMMKMQLDAQGARDERMDKRWEMERSGSLSPLEQSIFDEANKATAAINSPGFAQLPAESQKQYLALANQTYAQKNEILRRKMGGGATDTVSANPQGPLSTAMGTMALEAPKKPGWMEAEQQAKQAQYLASQPGMTPYKFFDSFAMGGNLHPEILRAALQKWDRTSVKDAMAQSAGAQSSHLSMIPFFGDHLARRAGQYLAADSADRKISGAMSDLERR